MVRRKSATPSPLLPFQTQPFPPVSDTLEYVNECSIFQEHYVYRCRRLLPAHPLHIYTRVHAGRVSGCATRAGNGADRHCTFPHHPRPPSLLCPPTFISSVATLPTTTSGSIVAQWWTTCAALRKSSSSLPENIRKDTAWETE